MRPWPALLLLAVSAFAQDGPQSPRDLWERFLDDTGRYAREKDEDALARAGRLFDLSDLPADKDAIGRQAAIDLRAFLDRLDAPVETAQLPGPAEGPGYHALSTEFGNVLSVRMDDGTWRFSRETRKQADDLFQRVIDREARADAAPPDTASWIRARLPGWLLHRAFLLQNWQWAALLVLIFLGIVGGAIGRFLVFRAGRKVAARRGVKLKEGRVTGRPFAVVAAAAVWLLGLRFLGLPEGPFLALAFAARLVLMVGVVWSAIRVVDWITEVLESVARRTDNRLDDLVVPMVRKALKVFTVALGIVWIADNMGMDIAALLAGLGIGGIAIALASKDTVENLFGALSILSDRPFQVGDWIKMGDIEGTVEEVGFRSTRVRTFYDSQITFPNAALIRSSVDNFGERRYRRFKTTIGVTYDTPADRLEAFVEGIRELIRRHPYTRKDYYHVYFNGFGASALDVLVYMFFECPDWATELRERQRLLLDTLRLGQELGVSFAFPTRTVHLLNDTPPEHEEPETVKKARATGRDAARGIVEEFTGQDRPPPVVIADEPDDSSEA